MYEQVLDPVGGSLFATALFAALPLITLFVLLGGLKLKAHWAALASLAIAIVVAVAVYSMPGGQVLDAAVLGACFGLFPIMFIVWNAIWIYNMTDATGHFAVLRRSFAKISDDQRIQAVIIAFSFGALIEALAGFGAPVAITAAMLLAVGFKPMQAAAVALVANTAPVAFGAIATPIITLSEVTSLPKEDLGAMVGRQTPFLAVIVPLILIGMVDGKRGIRQCWPAAVVGGVAFAIGQFACSNFLSVEITDIVASLLSAGAIVALLRFWSPAEPMQGEPRFIRPAIAGAATADAVHEQEVRRRSDDIQDPRGDVFKAYAPYIIIVAVLSLAQWGPIKTALEGFTQEIDWPGLNVVNADGEEPGPGDLQVQLGDHAGHAAARLRAADHARAARLADARHARLRADAEPAQVGDADGRHRARARLRHELLGADADARPVDRRRGRRARLPVLDHRLARRRRDRLRHIVELAVRRAPGAGRQRGGHEPDAAGGRQLVGRRARQDDLAAEPRDRRGRGRPRRPGGRAVPQGPGMEPRCCSWSCACSFCCNHSRSFRGWSSSRSP